MSRFTWSDILILKFWNEQIEGATERGRVESLQTKNSLSGVFFKWSGRRDSNSRQSAWKADTLPTELRPHFI